MFSNRCVGETHYDFFFLITGSNLFLMLSYSVRARWSQTRVAFQGEIRLIAAATKPPNSPNQHATVWFSNVRWCVDRCCSFKSDLGECFAPQGRSARCSEQKVLVLKTALIICLVCVCVCVRLTLLQSTFTMTSSQGPQWQSWHWRSLLKAKAQTGLARSTFECIIWGTS